MPKCDLNKVEAKAKPLEKKSVYFVAHAMTLLEEFCNSYSYYRQRTSQNK